MQRSLLWKWLQIPCRIFTSLYFDLRVYGIKNVPTTGPALLLANHQSYLDPVLVAVRLYRPVSFFAKSELFENRYFGALIRALHAIPVRRGEGDIAAVREVLRQLDNGRVINLYPEGTRTKDGQVQSLQKGIALILRKAHVPVIPVTIDGSFEAWPRKAKIFHSYPINVMYGKPLALEGMKADEVLQTVENALRVQLAELRSLRGNSL